VTFQKQSDSSQRTQAFANGIILWGVNGI